MNISRNDRSYVKKEAFKHRMDTSAMIPKSSIDKKPLPKPNGLNIELDNINPSNICIRINYNNII